MVWLFYGLFTIFTLICLILTLLVLIQKGRGGGIAGAFGGSGGNTAFGAKTGDVLTWATSIVFGCFILFAIFLNLVANQIGHNPKPAPTQTVSGPVAPTPSSGMPAAPPAPPGPTH
jgi:preprotein translocase subunit SecG